VSDRKREVVGKHSTWYVCDVHGWDFTNEDKDTCPVCLGESQERERIISLIEKTHEHGMTHSERCAIRHDFADYLVERINGENK
jgi:hypothetical protein